MSDNNDSEETIKIMAGLDKCPHCGANLVGDPIPETRREFFGGKTHGSRLIAMYDQNRDRTSHYQCPDCKELIERGDEVELGFRTCDVVVQRSERKG